MFRLTHPELLPFILLLHLLDDRLVLLSGVNLHKLCAQVLANFSCFGPIHWLVIEPTE